MTNNDVYIKAWKGFKNGEWQNEINVANFILTNYEEYKGDIDQRSTGSIVAYETGDTSGYGLFNTQDRGRLFVGPGVAVYEGQIVGENPKNEDIVCNVCKKKQATNMRAAGSDDALRLVPPTILSLEKSLEFIKDDELVEVTPESIRLRKMILSKEQRMKQLRHLCRLKSVADQFFFFHFSGSAGQ